MSVLARRRRDEQFARERELVAMRDAVVRATTSAVPTAGSSATLEAVDEALAQLVAAQAHLGDAMQVKVTWIKYARCRLLDEHRSADAKRRDAIAVDEHRQALQVSVCGDPDEVLEDDRQSWRVREILSVLRGEQRKWAEAWYHEVLSVLPAGAQPRGLPDALGWTTAKTEKTAQRARRKMAAFVTRRQSGEICAEQRALLDGFISASSSGHLSAQLDHERYEAIVFHVVGCDDCFATWQSHRRTPSRALAIVMLPIDAIVAGAQGLAAKVAAITAAAATSVLGRLGIGGAAAGGGAATIGAKTATVCVGVVCAAAGAGGEIAGVLPPIAPEPKHDAPVRAERKANPPAATAPAAQPVIAAPTAPPPPPASAQSTRPPATPPPAAAPPPPPPPPPPVATPGDLAPASTAQTPPPPPTAKWRPAPPPPPSSSCVPGDIGC